MPHGVLDVSATVCAHPWHPPLLLESESQHVKSIRQLSEASPTNHHVYGQNSTRYLDHVRRRVQEAVEGCNAAFECGSTAGESKTTYNASQVSSLLSSSAPDNLSPESADDPHQENLTTIMIRNIPYTYTVSDLQDEIDQLGFTGLYDLLHLPLKGKKNSHSQNIGYAFINLVTIEAAAEFLNEMRRYQFKLHPNKGFRKVATVSAARLQGLYANIGSPPTPGVRLFL